MPKQKNRSQEQYDAAWNDTVAAIDDIIQFKHNMSDYLARMDDALAFVKERDGALSSYHQGAADCIAKVRTGERPKRRH